MYSVLTIDLTKENLAQILKLSTCRTWVISGSQLSSITILYVRRGNVFHWEKLHYFSEGIYMCICLEEQSSSVVGNLVAEGWADCEANNRWEALLRSIYTSAWVPFSPELCDPFIAMGQCLPA